MANQDVSYLVFDIESIADGAAVGKIRYPNDAMEPLEAVERYRRELMEKFDRDFVPYTFQLPVSIAVAKVDASFRLLDLVCLDEPEYRPHILTENFWRGWSSYRRPTLVSFNGRTFDIPLLELAAFRFGISIPEWFNLSAPTYEQSRHRFNWNSHLDLHDVLTNHGASRFTGGLNLAANHLGKPGKLDVQGHMVQDMYHEGRLAEINDYCRCDVLDTYFVFLRVNVMFGRLTLDQEQSLVAETRTWLEQRSDEYPIYQDYLDHWGNWDNPWQEASLFDSTVKSG